MVYSYHVCCTSTHIQDALQFRPVQPEVNFAVMLASAVHHKCLPLHMVESKNMTDSCVDIQAYNQIITYRLQQEYGAHCSAQPCHQQWWLDNLQSTQYTTTQTSCSEAGDLLLSRLND